MPTQLDSANMRVRISALLPTDFVEELSRAGTGSITRGLLLAAKLLRATPAWADLHATPILYPQRRSRAVTPPPLRALPPNASRTFATNTRHLRDAMIYFECTSRAYSRETIATRYGVSVHRVHQIYAAQRRNPPAYPSTDDLRTHGLLLDTPTPLTVTEPTTPTEPTEPTDHLILDAPTPTEPTDHLILDAPTPTPTPAPTPPAPVTPLTASLLGDWS